MCHVINPHRGLGVRRNAKGFLTVDIVALGPVMNVMVIGYTYPVTNKSVENCWYVVTSAENHVGYLVSVRNSVKLDVHTANVPKDAEKLVNPVKSLVPKAVNTGNAIINVERRALKNPVQFLVPIHFPVVTLVLECVENLVLASVPHATKMR